MDKKKVVWAFVFLIGYVLLINVLANINLSLTQTETTFVEGGANVNVGLGESVDIYVERNRFYGIIYEQETSSDIMLLSFIPLPLERYGFRFRVVHGIALLSFFIILKGGRRYEKNLFNNPTVSNSEYSGDYGDYSASPN